MAGRRRSPDRGDPDGTALWRRVTATVAPLPGRPAPPVIAATKPRGPPAALVQTPVPLDPPVAAAPGPQTLDARWDRDLRRGAIVPDRTVDLHELTLADAHATVDSALEDARRDGARVLLLVTGKPRPDARAGGGDGRARGAIRAQIGDWLAASRHAAAIAAVRPAHPRHGGAGALYVILRRR